MRSPSWRAIGNEQDLNFYVRVAGCCGEFEQRKYGDHHLNNDGLDQDNPTIIMVFAGRRYCNSEDFAVCVLET